MIIMSLFSCNKADNDNDEKLEPAYKITKNIDYNGISVNLIIDKPEGNEFDVLMVFHGTVNTDDLILQAADNILNVFKDILDNKDLMIISVAYPEENLLFGDNIHHCEAALLWLKNNAKTEIGVIAKKIFLAGHSQGGYLVTRLNILHETNGVIANAPGPLNLLFRCGLEENGNAPNSQQCNLLRDYYGTTTTNPSAYTLRSLLNFTSGFKSDILFVQGLNDSQIQMYSWPKFKENLMSCNSCQKIEFLELQGFGHNSLFVSSQAILKFNEFLNSRL